MSDTNEKLKAQLYQLAVTYSQLRKCDIKDVFVNDFNIKEREKNGRVTAIIELDVYDYQEGGLPKDEAVDAPKKKLEEHENVSDSETFKVMPLVEPPLECGEIYVDGVPIEEAIKAINDSKRQPIKEQTLDEFNNARAVSYGSYIKTEPLTDK